MPRPVYAFLSSSWNATFKNNTFVNLYTSDSIFYYSEGRLYNFTEWKSRISGDANSRFINMPLQSGETQQIFYNVEKTPKTINLGSKVYRDVFGNSVTGSFILQPFTSRILIGPSF